MSRRVLVAEDNRRLADFCIEYLEDLGFEAVGPVPSVRKAQALLSEQTVDAGCLDVRLSDGLVFPLATLLRERNIPFLFCSGYDDADAFPPEFQNAPRLSKPYTQEEMDAALRSLFSGDASTDAA